MKLQNKIEAILGRYGLSFEDEMPADVSSSVKLEDGTEIMVEGEMSSGSAVYIENEEGEKIPMPNGLYKTEDEQEFEVEDGKISAVVASEESEAGADEAPDEEMAKEDDEKEEEVKAEEEEEEEVKAEEEEEEEKEKEMAKFSKADMVQAVGDVSAALSKAHKTEVSELKAKIEELETKLSATPAGEPVGRVPSQKQQSPVNTFTTESRKVANQIFEQYQ